MGGIIAEEEEIEKAPINDHNNTMPLSQLQTLLVERLPKLESISSRALLTCNALKTITIEECPQLKKLPFSMHNLPSALKDVKASSKEWWDGLEWDHPQTKAHFQLYLKV